MVALYEGELYRDIATVALIKGLEDQNKVIKQKLLHFWSDTSRLSSKPSERLLEMMKFKSDFNDEKNWLQCTVWLLLDLIKLTRETQGLISNSFFESHQKSPEGKDSLKRLDMEESKEEVKSSFPGGSYHDKETVKQSFGQTLELSSSLKNSRYYKSYQKESLLMSMQNRKDKNSDQKSSMNASKGMEGSSLSRSLTQNMDSKPSGLSLNPFSNIKRSKDSKVSRGLAKFFEKNEISRNVITVGRNKNVRFGPDGVFRVTNASIKEVKKRQQAKAEIERNKARKKLMKKLREKSRPLNSQERSQIDNQSVISLQEDEDILPPLQCLVLLDADVASSLFCDLFGVNFPNIFDKEPSIHVKHDIAEAAIKILAESIT